MGLLRLLTRHPSGFNTMEDIMKWLESHSYYNAYSFDVFDTLLRRRIDPPELIKHLVAERVSELLAKSGTYVSPQEIMTQRHSVENMLLPEAISKGWDPDYSLNDVIAGTVKALRANSILATEHIVNYEIDLEKKAAEAMPGALAVLTHLKSIGKRVICISDSYLSINQMSSILEHHGLLKYIDQLYVSSEVGKRKSTGRLFQHVFEKEGKKFVHIGDNHDSDYIIPKKLGIKALWFHSRSEQCRKSKLKTLLDSKNKMDYVSTIIRSTVGYKSELQRVGYEVLGPALTVFVHNIAEQARKDNVEVLFFVARDGYAMKKIYETLQRTIYVESALPPGRYMCLGRLPVRLASLRELSYASILDAYAYIARLKGRSVSLKDILGSYGLQPHMFISIAKQYDLDLNEPIINSAQDERLPRLLESSELKEVIRTESAQARELLRDYLTGIGFMGKKKVAVVDANAEGITQSILDMIFSDDTSYPVVRRYYFNLVTLNVDTAGIKPELSNALGIVTDWRSYPSGGQVPFRIFGLLIELFCHPNHGVTVGYKRVGDRTIPIFRKTPQERVYPLTSQGLRGILSYATGYGIHYRLHSYTDTELLSYMKNNVRQWVLRPPRTDAASLKHLSFTSDWPIETNHQLMQRVTFGDIVTIKGIHKKVEASIWPQATLSLAPAPRLSRVLYRASNYCGQRSP